MILSLSPTANQALCCFETHTVVCALCGENIRIKMTTFASASAGKQMIYQKFRPEPKATKKLDASKLR